MQMAPTQNPRFCAFQGIFAVFVFHVVQDLICRPLQTQRLVRILAALHVLERFDHLGRWAFPSWALLAAPGLLAVSSTAVWSSSFR